MEPGKGATPKMMAGSSMELVHTSQIDDTGRTVSSRGQKMATGNQQRIIDAISTHSTKEDEYNDMIIMLTKRVQIKNFLEAAPQSITLLGQLMILASTKDFKLPASASKIKHSESFRTCLVQISNRAWEAFNEAHMSMHQIEISSANLPRHLKLALSIISKGTQRDMKTLLPRPLKSIENIANECLTLSSATEKKFVDVMELIANVLEACTEAKGQYEEQLRKAKAALEVAELNRIHVEKAHENSEKRLDDLKNKADEAKEEFKKAMEEKPGTWELLGVTILENIFQSPFRNMVNINTTNVPDASAVSKNSQIIGEPHEVYMHAERLRELCTSLPAYVKNSDDQEKDKLAYFEALAKDLKKQMMKAESEANKNALPLCEQALLICSSLTSLRDSLNSDNHRKTLDEISAKAQEMETSYKEFQATCSESITSATNTSPIPKSTPPPTSMSVRDSAIDGWHRKVSEAREQYKDDQKREDEAYRDSQEKLSQLHKVIREISQFNLEKINFDEIRKTLSKGMHALAEVREQWGKLVRFFQEISSLIKNILNKSLSEFTESVADSIEMDEYQTKLSDFSLGMIYTQAFTASKVAHVVNHIASMYMMVSNTAIMDSLASLPKLLVPENAQDGMNKLMSNCEQTQKVIREMVEKKHAEYVSAISDRINQITCELQDVPPVEPMSTQKAVKRKSEASENESATSKAMSEKKSAASEEKDPPRLAKRICRV